MDRSLPGTIILVIFLVYFLILYLVSFVISKRSSDNQAFFSGNKKSPWYILAIGMVGTSISGVTFISVPGMVGRFDLTYMQMVFGFFLGYLVVAYILLPLYYRLNLISIYSYLGQRFGKSSYKTGASFFILSRIIGSAAKLYIVALILQSLIFDYWHIPFEITVSGMILFIWLYTRKSGIKTIIWTDTFQTLCVILAAIVIIFQLITHLDTNTTKELSSRIYSSEYFKIFDFDLKSSQNFFKQFLSGIFIVIVMTGLDQDIMQKNLTCKNLKDARKNMLSYGFLFIPINFMFLILGILLIFFANDNQITLPTIADEILPYVVANNLGFTSLILFTIGIISASFANADSALTSLTTSFCVDIINIGKMDEKKALSTRKSIHFIMSFLFIIVILIIHNIGQDSILNTIYKVASYTYGPLLGMFTLGLFSKITVKDKYMPVVCIIAPLLCYVTEALLLHYFEYKVRYEILMLNGAFTMLGMFLIKDKNISAEKRLNEI